jgi:hypothetical protein
MGGVKCGTGETGGGVESVKRLKITEASGRCHLKITKEGK